MLTISGGSITWIVWGEEEYCTPPSIVKSTNMFPLKIVGAIGHLAKVMLNR